MSEGRAGLRAAMAPTTGRVWRQTGAIAALIVVLFAVLRALPVDEQRTLTRENSVVAYAGAIGLFATAVLMFLVFLRFRHDRAADSFRVKPVVALLIAAVFLFAAGEEISWGQRFFGIETPAELANVNDQGETNLHNLKWLRFDEYRLFTLVWYPYVLGLPLLAALVPKARRLLARLGPTVPRAAWPFGLLYLLNDGVSWFVGKSLVAANGGYDEQVDASRIELRETIFSLLCAFTAFLVWKAVKRRRSPAHSRAGAPAGREREASRV